VRLPAVVADPFHAIVQSLDAPMLVVTTVAGGERSGCLVGFHTQCSIEPARWLVCISVVNHTYRIVHGAQYLVMHFLREDQFELARVFGAETGDAVDKFAQCAWHDGPGGVPVLAGCDWIAGHIIGRLDLGDHEGQLVDVIDAGRDHPGGSQLGFQQVERLPPGHPA
jgi:flavin reductase (DIM6/NTAB) family NADH-FMN oxidoreductase RutF